MSVRRMITIAVSTLVATGAVGLVRVRQAWVHVDQRVVHGAPHIVLARGLSFAHPVLGSDDVVVDEGFVSSDLERDLQVDHEGHLDASWVHLLTGRSDKVSSDL